MTAAVELWTGRTAHVREQPFYRAFTYTVAMIEVDIDRLDEADRASRLFSVNRFAALAFHTRDHGSRLPGASLRTWATQRFEEAGVDAHAMTIRLLSFPRVLGYGFAPISLWFAWDQTGSLRGVIYEVHNTFGEAHAYVAAIDDDQATMTADKEFYVSPFFDVSGNYRFTLRKQRERMNLVVENINSHGRAHVASLLLRHRAMTSGVLLRSLVLKPFSGVGVMAAIHWQALLLWLQGAKYHANIEQRANRTTLVEPPARSPVAHKRARKRA